jgi:hypothetical protein
LSRRLKSVVLANVTLIQPGSSGLLPSQGQHSAGDVVRRGRESAEMRCGEQGEGVSKRWARLGHFALSRPSPDSSPALALLRSGIVLPTEVGCMGEYDLDPARVNRASSVAKTTQRRSSLRWSREMRTRKRKDEMRDKEKGSPSDGRLWTISPCHGHHRTQVRRWYR